MTAAVQTPAYEPIAQLLESGVEAEGVRRVLRTVRKHLRMDVAFVSRFEARERVFEHVDDDGRGPIQAGQRMALEDGYCLKIVQGVLPACVPDIALEPAMAAIPAPSAMPIRSHLGVPVKLESGEVYGTLCCFGFEPNSFIGERDVQMMRAFAEVLAYRIDETLAAERVRRRRADEVHAVMGRGGPAIVFQRIQRLRDGGLAGFECLARFEGGPRRTPEEWFKTAHRAGCGIELEMQAIGNALANQPLFPPGCYLSVNASARSLLSDRLEPVLSRFDLVRTVIELTEHDIVDDYEALATVLKPLRRRGLRLAVDDAGAGYASMRHILHLEPDMIKLDMSLTQDIDRDRNRRALARGLTAFAHDIGSAVVAEGVETESEFNVLRGLGVDHAQGYYLARPQSIDHALAQGSEDERGTPKAA